MCADDSDCRQSALAGSAIAVRMAKVYRLSAALLLAMRVIPENKILYKYKLMYKFLHS